MEMVILERRERQHRFPPHADVIVVQSSISSLSR